MTMAVDDLRTVAEAAVRRGGAVAQGHFRGADLTVDWKADASPVTIADQAAERVIRELIASRCPEDGWLGEETGHSPGRSGRSWMVDPIDGTRNFVRGIPLWSVLVACVDDADPGRVLAAAIGFPAIDEWYDAALGSGARCNGKPIRVSSVTEPSAAGFAYYTHAHFCRHDLEPVFRTFSLEAQLARGGGDAYMHMLVASGRMELCIEPGLQAWDLAASWLIVEEAGGRVSGLRGERDIASGGAILSNGHLHELALARCRAQLDGPGAE